MLSSMRWDSWELIGLLGEGLFFTRLLIQWLASEKQHKPVIPTIYWHMSLAGALILLFYAIHIGSFVVLLPQLIGIVFYTRELQLDIASRARETTRIRLGFDTPAYPWPKLSVIVPVHNEEKRLAETLANLTSQLYPEPKPQIIAALNGCRDTSKIIAQTYPGVDIMEDEHSGMSFGKNLGARAASGSILVFVDADTRIPDNGLQLLAEAVAGKTRFIGTVAGAPDKGGFVVRLCFHIANRATRRKSAHAPGGVMVMDRDTFDAIGGFDENLPQGTSTDCIWRGLKTGAEYVFVDSFKAVTSIRRFEKTGIIRQMLAWRSNHKAFAENRSDKVHNTSYEDIR